MQAEDPDPRWSLANERTLLAHLRTSLAFLVAGLAVAGSAAAADVSAWLAVLGLPLIAVGTVLGATSWRRYDAVDAAMRAGDPLPPPSTTRHLGWAVAVVGVASLVLATVDLVVGD